MNLLRDRRLWIHFLFWALILALLFLLNSNRYPYQEALVVTAIYIGIVAALFYLNYLWLSHFYTAGKYVTYFSVIALFLGLGVLIMYQVQIVFPSSFESRFRNDFRPGVGHLERPIPPWMMDRDPGRVGELEGRPTPKWPVRPMIFRVVPNTLFLLVTWALSSFLRTADEARKREREVHLLRAEQFDTELKLLKSQINPHFLFNALNNIYSLTVTKSEKAPDMLLKLSSMLRYVLYEGSDDRVPLASEIKYIHDYIDLQRLKDEEIENIEFKHTEQSSYWIHPMLLIPFVENAFKHSKIEDLETGWIKISLEVLAGPKLSLIVENSLPEEMAIDKTGGIGIENVRRRLDLLYTGAYVLDIHQNERSFHVRLQIPLE